VSSVVQLDELQPVPDLQVLDKNLDSESSGYILYPLPVVEGLSHGALRTNPSRDSVAEAWG